MSASMSSRPRSEIQVSDLISTIPWKLYGRSLGDEDASVLSRLEESVDWSGHCQYKGHD
jgi:hypothetical protein